MSPQTKVDYVLPAHAAEVMALFAHADATDEMWWRTERDGSIHLSALCSDTFHWATADGESIEEGDVDLLRRCFDDLRPYDEEHLLGTLFAARKRGMRPMRRWLVDRDGAPAWKSHDLFLAAGPERDPGSEG